jgi:hypothetical protein
MPLASLPRHTPPLPIRSDDRALAPEQVCGERQNERQGGDGLGADGTGQQLRDALVVRARAAGQPPPRAPWPGAIPTAGRGTGCRRWPRPQASRRC